MHHMNSGTAHGTNAIEISGLIKRFGTLTAVDGLNLSVARGTLFGFLGPNGAGKSTTLKMLTGLLIPTAGTAKILGHDVVREPVAVKRNIGVVGEELALFDRLTASEYLEFVGRMYGMPLTTIRQRAAELLDLLDIGGSASKLLIDHSHGMQKKVALAAALIHDPDVLFLDEPFEGMDAIGARLVKTILARLRKRGVTIFLTSHILEIVERLCSHVAIIHRGRLVASGTMDELRHGVVSETGSRMTLEDLFVALVGGPDHGARSLSWLE